MNSLGSLKACRGRCRPYWSHCFWIWSSLSSPNFRSSPLRQMHAFWATHFFLGFFLIYTGYKARWLRGRPAYRQVHCSSPPVWPWAKKIAASCVLSMNLPGITIFCPMFDLSFWVYRVCVSNLLSLCFGLRSSAWKKMMRNAMERPTGCGTCHAWQLH